MYIKGGFDPGTKPQGGTGPSPPPPQACDICGREFISARHPEGGTRTCEHHRGLLPAFGRGFLKWDVDLQCDVPGPRLHNPEVETLRTENAELRRQLVQTRMPWE